MIKSPTTPIPNKTEPRIVDAKVSARINKAIPAKANKIPKKINIFFSKGVVDRFNQILSLFIASIGLILLFIPVIFFVFFHFTLDKKVKVIEENINQCNEEKDFEEDKLKMNLVLLKYLNLIDKHNGRITSLSFDGNSISMNICSIFPEYLMEESSDEKNAAYYFSPVSYVEEKPSFNLEVKRKKIKTYGNVCKKELFFSFRIKNIL